MNSALYGDVIENELIPSINMWHLETNGIYQQDNAPYYKTRDIKALFEDLSINILPWPAHSPDLNPVENLWAIIDKKFKKIPMHTIQELNERLRSEWLSVESTICANLIKSMPKRIAECVKAKGDEKSTKQLALIQIQIIPQQLPFFVILVELAHLPPTHSLIHLQIK
ncbi:unnamed protein product [Rotaria sordida]|uniref:Tc1-like transposase DDE domain-containing protein n=1 Tax=Rotaria sordida TaxID=392033 RepID=A0A818VR53_9BILA|nr:unnamed protein product [Rotaria sordida]